MQTLEKMQCIVLPYHTQDHIYSIRINQKRKSGTHLSLTQILELIVNKYSGNLSCQLKKEQNLISFNNEILG